MYIYIAIFFILGSVDKQKFTMIIHCTSVRHRTVTVTGSDTEVSDNTMSLFDRLRL